MTKYEKLIDLYFEGRLTPAQWQEIQACIKSDPACARAFSFLGLLNSCIRNEFVEADLRQSLSRFSTSESGESQASDTGQMASESILRANDEDPEKTREIEAYAQRQLLLFLSEQQRLQEDQKRRQARSQSLHISVGIFIQRAMCALQRVILLTTRATVGLAVALALFLLIMGIVQHIESQRVIATLGQTQHAQWDKSLESRDLRRGSLQLKKGYAQINFIKGAQVLLQAPCEVKLVSSNKMEIVTGALTANVPKQAIGFGIETPSAYIEDYGTSFGVAVDARHDSEIHVFKGSVGLRSNARGNHDKLEPLRSGQAAQADMRGNIQVGSIGSRHTLFVKQMPDPNQGGIPGLRLDLADVVGGGNGFGTGVIGGQDDGQGTVNPLTGHLNDAWRPGKPYQRVAGHVEYPMRYTQNNTHPYIDGVSLPDGDQGDCIVSSRGHVFAECPDTDSQMKWNVVNGWRYVIDPVYHRTTPELTSARGISMHTNCLITFDLDRMRMAMPGIAVAAFSACVEVPALAAEVSESDILVLVDGQVRFKKMNMRAGQRSDIDIEIRHEDRFLTLVTTDSQTEGAPHWSNQDYCFFAQPILRLAPTYQTAISDE